MATTEEPWDQLAIRIQKELHSRLKLHWVTQDIAVMHFVVEAIEPTLLWLFSLSPFYTKRFAFFVGRRCRTGTIRDVAREVHLDWKTVKELEQQYMREQCRRAGTPAPKVLGIDEVSIRKRHTYRIVVSDLLRRRPIWFGGRPLGGLGERRVDR